MKTFVVILISLVFTNALLAQQSPYYSPISDSLNVYGFTDKSEAKNVLKDTLKEGKWIERIDDRGDVTKAKGADYYRLTIYKDGLPIGISHYYFSKNDKLAGEMPYKNGKKDGIGRLYYESGTLLKKIYFKDGLVYGVDSLFYESGNLEIAIPYADGKKNGIGRLYYKSGKLETETPYTNNLKEGVVKVYYENGNISSEIPCSNDMRNGVEKDYYENGVLKKEATYKNDLLVGAPKNYDEKGNATK